VKFAFRAKALEDLEWFEKYYTEIFPDGSERAMKQFFRTKENISSFPEIGRPFRSKNQREYVIPGIPFSFVYRIRKDVIEVVRVFDLRSNRRKHSP
jgi:plasmid stabilization system protein ParE